MTPACEVCGRTSELLRCRSHGTFCCATHMYKIRDPMAYSHWGCTFEPFDVELTTRVTPSPETIWAQAKMREDEESMKANNKAEATREGKEFARLFGGLVKKEPTTDYELLADFAQYFSQNVLNYTAADLANGWAKGFISEWTAAPKSKADPATAQGMELINNLRAMLGMEPLDAPVAQLEAKNGE